MIMLDGHDLKECSKKNLRSSINVVLQNPYINENATIKSNLLGIEESVAYTDEELQQVLVKSSLSDINLDDKASKLSGGQVQLLAIA